MENLDYQTRGMLRQLQRRERDKQRYVRITMLMLLDSGYSVEQTATVLGIDSSTVYRLLERYEESDTLEDYLHENYKAYRGLLTPVQLTEITKELTENLYQSSAEVAEHIKKRYKVDYALSSIVALMRRLGFVYKKTRLVPAKADRASQEEGLAEIMRLLEQHNLGDSVYFCDAVHPQHNTRASYGWIKSGESFEISSNSGRSRLNINGAINAHDITRVVVREDERIDTAKTPDTIVVER